VRELRPDMPEVRHKFGSFAEICGAWVRRTDVIVHVNMKHPDIIVECKLQCLANSSRTHHCANCRIVLVVLIVDGNILASQYD